MSRAGHNISVPTISACHPGTVGTGTPCPAVWGQPSPKSCWCLDKVLEQSNLCRTGASSSAAPPVPSLSLSPLLPSKLGRAGLAAIQHSQEKNKW